MFYLKVEMRFCVSLEKPNGHLFHSLNEKDFYVGLRSKLMGQVNLVRIVKDYLTCGRVFHAKYFRRILDLDLDRS